MRVDNIGFDSVETVAINDFLAKEFGVQNNIPPETVDQVILLATGAKYQPTPASPRRIPGINTSWSIPAAIASRWTPPIAPLSRPSRRVRLQNPDQVMLGDTELGLLHVAWLSENGEGVFISALRALPAEEKRIGVIAPQTVVGQCAIKAIIKAGRVPLPMPFTAGSVLNLKVAKAAGLRHIIAPKKAIEKMEAAGLDFKSLKPMFWYMEDIKENTGMMRGLYELLKRQIAFPASPHADNGYGMSNSYNPPR